jgi:NAD(P)H-nitrite reductase
MKHLILGNGPAGVVAAETLRKVAPADDILMVGFEDAPPYSRMAIPYLLEGNIDESGTYLRKDAGHFERLRIRQLRGRAVALDTAKRKVLFDDGHFEHYDRLLIATGSHPVRPPIPGVDLPSVQPAGRWPTRARSPRMPSPARACCSWAPASSAASSWRRSPSAACS